MVEAPKKFAVCCGQPLMPTMHVPHNELYCLECGSSYGMFETGSKETTPELQKSWEKINAEWDEHVKGKLLIPKSMRDGCEKCKKNGLNFDHPSHATDEEKEADREAREWLKIRSNFIEPNAVFVNVKSKSGRRWRVSYFSPGSLGRQDEWILEPLGSGRGGFLNEDGETIGGVHEITRTPRSLRERQKWRRVE